METLHVNNEVIKTYIFIDLETTGLPEEEQNRTEITELSFIAVHLEHLKEGVFPRVQNKINMCFKPKKDIMVIPAKLTGLDNKLMENSPPFSQNSVELLDVFLDHQEKPICLVAHNGNEFDYPILRTAILNTGKNLRNDVFCVDSLPAFRVILSDADSTAPNLLDSFADLSDEFFEDLANTVENWEQGVCYSPTGRVFRIQNSNEFLPDKRQSPVVSTPPPAKRVRTNVFATGHRCKFQSGFKLRQIFSKLRHLIPDRPNKAHMAGQDASMLLACVVAKSEPFINWANANKKRFNEIKHMQPGEPVGARFVCLSFYT